MTILRALSLVRRHARLVLLCGFLASVLALGVSLLASRVYTARAEVVFRPLPYDERVFGSDFQAPPAAPLVETATNLRLAALRAVSERTARAVGGGLRGDEVRERVSIAADGDSDVLSVEATGSSSSSARTLADEYARQTVAFLAKIDSGKAAAARDLALRSLARLTPAQRRGRQGRYLRERASRLHLAATLQTGNATLVQSARAAAVRSSPRVVLNGVLAGLLGLVLGVALAVRLRRRDSRTSGRPTRIAA